MSSYHICQNVALLLHWVEGSGYSESSSGLLSEQITSRGGSFTVTSITEVNIVLNSSSCL